MLDIVNEVCLLKHKVVWKCYDVPWDAELTGVYFLFRARIKMVDELLKYFGDCFALGRYATIIFCFKNE